VPRHPGLRDPVAPDARRQRLNAAHAGSGMPRVLLRAAQLLGMAWTLPNTVAGLLLGLDGLPLGAHVHARGSDLAIVFHHWPWGPGGAMTLGNVILHTGGSLDSPCMTYAHRAGHGDEPP